MRAESFGNKVSFLMDGEEYFAAIRRLLRGLQSAPPGPNSYVRLAQWSMKPDLRLADIDRGPTIVETLKGLADRGHRVEIVLWQPTTLDVMVGRRVGDTMAVEQNADAGRVHELLHGYAGGRIHVYREVYRGWIAGTTNHQKICIVSRAGAVSAVVGGLNMDNWYWDDTRHGFQARYAGSGAVGTIHDSGVLVEGPAALDVEVEWMRRWNKQYRKPEPAHPRGVQALPAGGSRVTVLTTNSESWNLGGEVDVAIELKRSLAAATKYVYFEGYAFADPGLVTRLCEKLLATPSLRVIVVIWFPLGFEDALGYLNRLALLKTSLTAGRWFETAAGRIDRAHCSRRWRVNEKTARSVTEGLTAWVTNSWLEQDCFEYWLDGEAASKRVSLAEITNVDQERVTFLGPKRAGKPPLYVHSKVAIFDDETLFVGTANFTYRSMRFDGEMMLRIDDPPSVAGWRQRLFKHWGLAGMTDVQAEFGQRRQLQRGPSAGLALEPITVADFALNAKPPKNKGNYTLY